MLWVSLRCKLQVFSDFSDPFLGHTVSHSNFPIYAAVLYSHFVNFPTYSLVFKMIVFNVWLSKGEKWRVVKRCWSFKSSESHFKQSRRALQQWGEMQQWLPSSLIFPSVTKSSSQPPKHNPLYLQYRVLVLTSCYASNSRNLYTVVFDMALGGVWIAATGLRAEME